VNGGSATGVTNFGHVGVMARAPDGTDMFEVVRFHSPSAGAQEPTPAANRPGLRHVAFKVDNVRGVLRAVEAVVGVWCEVASRANRATPLT
jgi:hypothetical protein